jgi:hypothetical protein
MLLTGSEVIILLIIDRLQSVAKESVLLVNEQNTAPIELLDFKGGYDIVILKSN